MTETTYKVRHTHPPVNAFIDLRQRVGWGSLDTGLAEQSLASSLFSVTVYCADTVVGVGRIVGDGYMYFYLQDIIVDPDYRNQGIGKTIMSELEAYLDKAATLGSTVGLFAAKGKEGFYSRYGYEVRCGDRLGQGMSKFK